MDSFNAAKGEPSPTGNGTDVTALVVKDLQDRSAAGEKKYGTRLKTNNGRNVLVDIYQEILDAAMYIRQRIEEERVNS